MPELQPLSAGHAAAVLAFEVASRDYFALTISDRGDDWFAHFTDRYDAVLADQALGRGSYYVLVDDDGSVLGRFNLYHGLAGVADLGYRVGRTTAGRGVATATVIELCGLAASRHRLRTLRAAVSSTNVASQRVLHKAGFHEIGPTQPRDVGGKRHGTWFERDLSRRG